MLSFLHKPLPSGDEGSKKKHFVPFPSLGMQQVVFTDIDIHPYKHFFFLLQIFFKDFIYLFMRDTEREAETQAEGEGGSLRGA